MPALSAPQNSSKNSTFFGRYRTIIFAIAFFLVFDLSVLIVNFYTSFQMTNDAIGINLSGRQRMLSQRTTKALMTVVAYAEQIPGISKEQARAELKQAVELFDSTLNGFQFGAIVMGANNSNVFLKAVQDEKSKEALRNASAIWTPYLQLLQPVINGTATPEQQRQALEYALTNNTILLGYMNDLTNALELVADQRAFRLRMVQTVGISLALLNFIFILYKFLGQLRKADIAIEKSNDENIEILNTVREGLFLLNPDYTLGSQISASSHTLFGQKLQQGDQFLDILSNLVSEKTLSDANEYIKLLLSPHIKEQLVKSINPLTDIEATITNKLGTPQKHFLSFDFNRVLDKDGLIKHLLITVQDITSKVKLEIQLKTERARAQQEFTMLVNAIQADPSELRSFLNHAEQTLLHVNELLRSTAETKNEKNLLSTIHSIARDIHAFKGNALALNLNTIAQQAHAFESELKAIQKSTLHGNELGEALLSLPIPLGNLLSTITTLKGLNRSSESITFSPSTNWDISGFNKFQTTQIPHKQPQNSLAISNPLDYTTLNNLAQKVANDTDKKIHLHIALAPNWKTLPASTAQHIHEIVIQLIRNAIVHGIEPSSERNSLHKPLEGQIEVELKHTDPDAKKWILRVRDDGLGLSIPKIREKLQSMGCFSPQELDAMSDKQIITQIFRPDFSTANNISMHAGRGIGLDLVYNDIKKLRTAHLNIATRPQLYTEFTVTFSL